MLSRIINLLKKMFYRKQRSPMYFYLTGRFAAQSAENHQNSYAFLVCKNENKTSKNNTGNED